MSNNRTDFNRATTNSSSDSAGTPPQLSTLGLHRRTSKMSKSNESQRLLRSHTIDKSNDELFVKLPKFSKRPRAKNTLEKPVEGYDDSPKELVPTHERLYKFLKQPKSQRWIWCEFVESFIDKSVLSSGYDMKWYLDNIYPQLQERHLPLRCWQIVRRNMGKPRRFSPAFIESQKRDLNHDRDIVRLLQQRQLDMDQFGMPVSVMPKLIPMKLPMDTKVISLLRAPMEMLYKGRVVGYEPKDSSYLIKFDVGGKHIVRSMEDHLLHVVNECKGEPLADIIQESKDKLAPATDTSDDDKGSSSLLDALLQLNKLMANKRKTVEDMASMNEELEASGVQANPRRELKTTPQREKLQRRYAANMITLHRVNADILKSLRVAHSHLNEYEKDEMQNKTLPSTKILEKCRLVAAMDLKASIGLPNLKSHATRELIMRLQTMLYLFVELGQGNDDNVEAVLDEFLASITSDLPPQLHSDFQNVAGLLQSLREQIGTMHKMESEHCQQLLQLQQAETMNFIPSEDLDIEQDF